MGSHNSITMAFRGAACILFVILLMMHSATGGRSAGRGGSKVDPSSGNAATWPGHMEPLGAKAIKRPIPVLQGFPSAETFYLDYILGSLPVVFRDGAKLSPAFKTWTDQYLKFRPESQTTMVDVEMKKKEDRTKPTQRMPFYEFLERYRKEDEYMVDGLPTFLREDVLVPPPLVCDDILKRISDVVMWFSSGGTKSVVHNDDTDNINCLFSGQKEILFINYTQYRNQVNLDHPEGSYSSMDVDQVDMVKFPGMRDVEFYHASLYPGDCIYIPYKWIHQVNSVGRNIAVNVWFDHSCETMPSPEVCGRTDRRLTIADVSLRAEQPLAFEENFGEDEPSPYEDFITTLTRDEASWTEEDFTKVIQNEIPMFNDLIWNEECDVLAHEMFQLLDMTEDNVIDKEDMDGFKKLDELFHFQMEAKLLMLGDIGHEQEVQRRLKEYEAEMRRRPRDELDPMISIHHVEPLNLDDIDWGTTKDGKSKKVETNEVKGKETKSGTNVDGQHEKDGDGIPEKKEEL